MNEIVRADEAHTLTAQMDYARTVSSASMLPENYRGKPADILLAVGLGQSMGLSPAESLYRISVIKGKPTASAELIAANVRKAGHKLRVMTDEQAMSVRAMIVRADDPDFAFEVTRDLEWARSMKLDGNDNYRKQPLTMLQWRAITAVARLACPEALYGVSYTPDEMSDWSDRPTMPPQRVSNLADALNSSPAPDVGASAEPPAPPASMADEGDDHGPASAGEAPAVTSGQLKKIGAAMTSLGITDRKVALEYVADVIGREVASRNELTMDEAHVLIEALQADERDAITSPVTADEIAGAGE